MIGRRLIRESDDDGQGEIRAFVVVSNKSLFSTDAQHTLTVASIAAAVVVVGSTNARIANVAVVHHSRHLLRLLTDTTFKFFKM